MPHRYEQYLGRFESEAKEVLKSNGLPTSALKFGEKHYPVRNRLVHNARSVVLGVHHLRKEIEKNQIHDALDRFLTLVDFYLQMDMQLRVDSIGPNEVFLDDHLVAWLGQGKRSLDHLRATNKKESKRATLEAKAKELYRVLRSDREQKSAAVSEVASRIGVSERTIWEWKKDWPSGD